MHFIWMFHGQIEMWLYHLFSQNLAHELSSADQTDGEPKYHDVAQSLVNPFILKHRDKDVKVHAACCMADILRIFAPEAPYNEEQLKVITVMSSGTVQIL